MHSTLFFPAATLLTVLLTKYCMRYAPNLSLVDIPRGRKQHETITPVVGGIGIVFSFYFLANLTLEANIIPPAFWGAAMLLFVVGVLDDIFEFGSRPKFVAQIVAALMMIYWGGVRLTSLGNLFGTGDIGLGAASTPLTVFAMVGVINAFNMIDGIDGLSGTLGLIAALAMAGIALMSGLYADGYILLLLAFSIIGFLCLNMRTPWRRRAAVFLGDAGALFVGFILTWYAIKLSSPGHRCVPPVTMLWVMIVPLFDTIAVMSRRLLNGVSPFKADRGHIHHLLLDRGFGVSRTVLIIASMALVSVVFGCLAATLGEPLMLALFLGLLAAYFYLPGKLLRSADIY